jgi:hypothetical protein
MTHLILAGEQYYPCGSNDIRTAIDDLMDAIEEAKGLLLSEPDTEWAEVFDTDTMEVVWSEGTYHGRGKGQC